MPAFNFQKQFAPDVESGKKRQTIRAKRKDGRRPEAGQTAYLYTGMRTKSCRKLREEEIKDVAMIHIAPKFIVVNILCFTEQQLLNEFAELDGFESWEAMRDWFESTHGLPFYGDLIKW